MFLEPCVQDKAEKGDFSKGLLHNSIALVGTFKECKVPDCAVGESRERMGSHQLSTLQVTVLPTGL